MPRQLAPPPQLAGHHSRALGVVADIFAGPAAKPSVGDRPTDATRVIGVADMVDGRIAPEAGGSSWADLSGGLLDRHALRPSDVLVAARGSAPKVAWVGEGDLPAVASANILVVRARPNLRPGIVFAFLRSEIALSFIRGLSRSTRDQLSITARDLAAVEIPILPADMQEKIDAIVEAGEAAYAEALATAAARREIAHAIAINTLRAGAAG